MNIDCTIKSFKITVSDFEQQLLTGSHAACRAGQRHKQIEFNRSERQRTVVKCCCSRGGIDPQLANSKRGFVGWAVLLQRYCRTSQDSAQTSQQFARGKRFWNVIVGPEFQPNDAIRLFSKGSEHQNGGMRVLPQFTEDIKAVHAGKHDVEKDGAKLLALCTLQSFRPRVRKRDLIPKRREVITNQAAQLDVIINDQKACRNCRWQSHNRR